MWTDENAMLITIVLLLGVACVPIGAVLTFAKRSFFQKFKVLTGPRGTIDDEIAGVLRSTGLQLMLLGVLLVAFAVCFVQERLIALGVITVVILLVPIIFTIVRKRQEKRRKLAEKAAREETQRKRRQQQAQEKPAE